MKDGYTISDSKFKELQTTKIQEQIAEQNRFASGSVYYGHLQLVVNKQRSIYKRNRVRKNV